MRRALCWLFMMGGSSISTQLGLSIMVLKPGSDRTVQPEKPRTAHFFDSFSLKNHSMGKKQGPMQTAIGPQVLRSMIRPLLTIPYFPLNLSLKQKKKQKKSFKFCSLQSTSSFKFWLCSPPVMCV